MNNKQERIDAAHELIARYADGAENVTPGEAADFVREVRQLCGDNGRSPESFMAEGVTPEELVQHFVLFAYQALDRIPKKAAR